MTEADKKKIEEIAKKHGLALVVLFGSQATGYTHKQSDVDIGFISDRDIDYRENYDISIELGRIFKNPDVELVNLYNVSPEFKKQVSDTGIVLYESDPLIFDLYKIQAFKTYVEHKPLRELRRASLKKFIASHV